MPAVLTNALHYSGLVTYSQIHHISYAYPVPKHIILLSGEKSYENSVPEVFHREQDSSRDICLEERRLQIAKSRYHLNYTTMNLRVCGDGEPGFLTVLSDQTLLQIG